MNDPITSREPNQEKRIRIRTKEKAEGKEEKEFLFAKGREVNPDGLLYTVDSGVFSHR